MLNPPGMVVGIDLSMTSTGIARIYADGSKVVTATVESKGKLSDSLVDRAARIDGLAHHIIAHVTGPGEWPFFEVLIESPAHHMGAAAGTWDRAGLWWRVVGKLGQLGTPVHHAQASTIKKWITGSGVAGKNTVGVHVGRLFPDTEIANDDEADALAMAHLLAVRAGYPVRRRAGHTPAAYAAVKWADQ